jgi:raffinose/stachyose/melibiose transport system substrate-binding protein
MLKNRFVLLAVLVFLLIGTVAFAGGQPGAKEEKIVINWATPWVKGELGEFTYYFDLIDEYLADHPNVEVKIDAVSHDQYLNIKFKAMVAADALPEFFHINSMDVFTAYKAGRLMEWTDALNTDPKWRDSFLPLWDEVTFEKRVYAIPYQFITNEVFYYNSEILSQAGSSAFPTVWEDMLVLFEKLKGMDYMPVALGTKAGWPLWSHLGEPLCEYLCGPDWVKEIGGYTGKRGYDEPDFIKVLTHINNLMKKGYFNNDIVALEHGTEDNAYFFAGKAASTLSGSWGVRQMVVDAPADMLPKIKCAPIPRPSASKPNVAGGLFTGGSGWEFGGSPKMSEAQRNVVIDFVKILTGPEFARHDVEAMRIPVIKMDYVTGWDPSKVPQLQQDLNKLISAAPKIPLMNQEQSGPAMSEVLYKTTQELLVGTLNEQQAAKQIQAVFAKVVADLKKQ